MKSSFIGGRVPALKPLALASALSLIYQVAPAQSLPAQPEKTPELVVTASRLPQRASDVLSDNQVITAEQIAQSGQTTLAELLQKVRGIEITTNGGPGGNSSVFIRGAANTQNIVLVDGVRIGSSTLGGATWSSIPLTEIDRIEIVYGPLSSLYGADAMGGVIQVFTKKGGAGFHPTASVGVGSFNTLIAEAGIAGSAGSENTVHYALNVGHEKSDGFSATKDIPTSFVFNPDKDGYNKASASGRLSFDLAKGHELGVSFLQSRLNAQADGGPGSDDHVIGELENISFFSNNRFTQDWKSRFQLSSAVDRNDNVSAYPSRFNTKQTEVSWQNDLAIGPDQLQLVLERRKEKVDSTTSALSRERDTDSIALAYLLKRGSHLASASVRNDNSDQFGSHTTGNLGYGYRVTSALRLNASVGTSFRAPTFNELYYPGYGIAANKPERGTNAEGGVYYDDGNSQLSAVYFHNRLSDLIVYAPTCPIEQSTHAYGCAYNIDQATLEGLTFGASTSFQNFTLRGSIDFQNPRDDTTKAILARRAKRHGSLVLDYSIGAFKGGIEAIVSGRRFEDASNSQELGGYGVLNLHASYALGGEWSLFGRWNNALNKDYELAQGYATAGSNVFIGIRYGIK